MKNLTLGISLILFLLGSSSVFAQMGGGMMENQKGEMNQGQMMEQGGMMEHGQMMNDMMGMSNQMSEFMGSMSTMMKDMPAGNMKIMSSVMRDMSQQLMEMSKVMGRGKVSPKDMKKMQDRMTAIQKKMSGMEMQR